MSKATNLKRRSLVVGGLAFFSGCSRISSNNESPQGNSEDEFPQKAIHNGPNDPNYLGTHDSHEIKFKTIKYVQRIDNTANSHGFSLDFGNNNINAENTAAVLYFYQNGGVVGAGAQLLDSAGSFNSDKEFVSLPDRTNVISFDSYRISIVSTDSMPQLSKNSTNHSPRTTQREREYCEDENIPEEEDDPMVPNCNTNPYEPGIGGFDQQKERHFQRVEGYGPIEEYNDT